MADTVKVPGVGTLPKWGVFAGAGGVAVAVFLYYRNKKSSTATTAAAATATDQYPPDGTTGNPSDPYSTDPATGQTYGDEAAGSGGAYGAFGSVASTSAYPWDGSYGNPSDPYSMDPGTGQTYGDEGDTGTGTGTGTSGPPFSTNAAWSSYAVTQLQANDPSASPGDIQNALGVYISGQPATPAQRTIIFDAIAIAGDPPVTGPNGFPPKIQSAPGGGGGTTATNPVTGLKTTSEGVTGSDISWSPSAGATSYKVTSDKGTVEMTGTTTARIRDIGPSHTQATVSVLASPAAAGALPAKLVVKATPAKTPAKTPAAVK